jgi:hypothetical protein
MRGRRFGNAHSFSFTEKNHRNDSIIGEISGHKIPYYYYHGKELVNLRFHAGTVQNLYTFDAGVTNSECERASSIADMVDSIGFSKDDFVMNTLLVQSLESRRMLQLSGNPARRAVSHRGCSITFSHWRMRYK